MKYSKNSFSRFIPILLVVVITVVAVAAVIAIGRSLLGGGSSEPSTPGVGDDARSSLLSVDTSRSVRLTVRGPIVADEQFRSYRITITPDTRVMTTYEGYLASAIDTERLNNNTRAYEEFVYALDKRNFINGRTLSDEQDDLRGICANQKLYEFEILVNGERLKRVWTSDCGGSPGSAEAEVAEVLDMFLKQIPEGGVMAREVGLTQQSTFFRL